MTGRNFNGDASNVVSFEQLTQQQHAAELLKWTVGQTDQMPGNCVCTVCCNTHPQNHANTRKCHFACLAKHTQVLSSPRFTHCAQHGRT